MWPENSIVHVNLSICIIMHPLHPTVILFVSSFIKKIIHVLMIRYFKSNNQLFINIVLTWTMQWKPASKLNSSSSKSYLPLLLHWLRPWFAFFRVSFTYSQKRKLLLFTLVQPIDQFWKLCISLPQSPPHNTVSKMLFSFHFHSFMVYMSNTVT